MCPSLNISGWLEGFSLQLPPLMTCWQEWSDQSELPNIRGIENIDKNILKKFKKILYIPGASVTFSYLEHLPWYESYSCLPLTSQKTSGGFHWKSPVTLSGSSCWLIHFITFWNGNNVVILESSQFDQFDICDINQTWRHW